MQGILGRKINTFAPMQDGEKFVAIIKDFPMFFMGTTAMQARKMAADFRVVEAAKVLGSKFPDELRGELLAAQDRMAARRADKTPDQFKR